MNISNELSAIAARIAQITGAQPPGPVAPTSSGVDGLPIINPATLGSSSFASLVQAALDGQGGAGATVANAFPVSTLAPGAPAMLPPAQIDQLVGANAATFNVDPNLVKAIIANESGFNANATSSVGAQGLMQLMPGTANGLGVSNAYDPSQNVWGGTKYIKGLLDRFGGNVPLAVAAYNAGPGAVEKYGGVPPYPETQNYVQNVLSSYAKYTSQNGRASTTL